jgi:DNA-binding CsgD family transcriptional regulator/PAS domain-containing protein
MKPSPSNSSLLTQMYAAVGDDAAWQALVAQLCAYFQSSTGMLVVAGQGQRDQAFYAAHNHREEVARAYSDHWWQHDTWLHTGLQKGMFRTGMVARGSDIVPAHELRQTAFYKEFLLTMPAEHLLCAILSDGSDPLLAPPITLSLFRAPQHADFSENDVQALRDIYPHIHRAFELHWQMRSMREQLDVFHRSLDSMDFGLSFIDTAGKIRFANDAAKKIALGAGFIKANGLFDAKNAASGAASKALQALIEQAATGEGGAAVLDTLGTMALSLPVSRAVRTPAGESRAAVMLILIDPAGRAETALQFVSQAFSLSPAESRVLPLLLKGQTPTEIAQSLDLKLPTVRSQLSAIFAKTGTARQQELIRLLGSVPPVLTGQASS